MAAWATEDVPVREEDPDQSNPHETFDDTMDMKLECMIEPDASQFPPVHPGGMKHCEEMLAAAAVTDVQGATVNQSRFPTF
jgi:hypothetical protein